MELRRSQRVSLVVPVNVSWTTKDGAQHKESAKTEEVNAHGTMLRMKTPPPVSTGIELARPGLGKSAPARVVRIGNRGHDGLTQVAVELAVPSHDLWGIVFPQPPN